MWLAPCRVSLCQVPDSSTFMLTLWDLSHLQEATPICLQSLIDSIRWPEAIPMADCTAQTCAQAFLSGWIARFGVPASVTSDRGRQFVSELWRDVLHLFSIKPTQTTSYHPQANGMVERMHRQLKASLKARLTTAAWSHPQANGMVERMHRQLKASLKARLTTAAWSHPQANSMVERMHRQLKASLKARLTTAAWSHPQANGMVERMHRQLKASLKARLTTAAWCTQLPIVLLGMRTALKEDLGTSASELVYGTTLHIPGDFIHQAPQMTSPGSFADQLRQHMAQLRPSPVITHGQCAFHMPCDLQSATAATFTSHYPQPTCLPCALWSTVCHTCFCSAWCPSLPTSATLWWTIPGTPQVCQILQGGSWLTYR